MPFVNQLCSSNTQAEIFILKQDNVTKPKNMILKMQHSRRALAEHSQGFRLDSRMDRREEWGDEKNKFWIRLDIH